MFCWRVIELKVGVAENIVGVVGVALDLFDLDGEISVNDFLPGRRVLH
jgi:hypothetical protein